MSEFNNLPKFDSPPLVEVALGIEFETLNNWGIPHFGLYWGQIRHKYPLYSIQPPLDSQVEFFARKDEKQITVTFGEPPQVRGWFSNKQQNWLLQIQRDRFIVNWRKILTEGEYPRFHKFITRFDEEWEQFRNFIRDNDLGTLKPAQCELTYFNHIDLPEEWRETEILSNYLPCWAGKTSGNFLPVPEVVTINTNYSIPDNQGRLYISMQPVFRHVDAKEVIQLTVTSRVLINPNDSASMRQAIQIAHEWGVNGFTDFTSSTMHSQWRRKQ